MKKLFTLLLLCTAMCTPTLAQEEESPVYTFKAQSSAVAGNQEYSIKADDESLIAKVTYCPAITTNSDKTVSSISESWSATKLSNFTVNGFTHNYYNATADNARTVDPLAVGTVAVSPSKSVCPNTGCIKVVTENKATVIVYVTGLANNKGFLIVGGANCTANPTDMQMTSVSTEATEADWMPHTNEATTAATLGATGSLNIAVKFTAKAGTEYYICGMGTKWRFVGLQVQEKASSAEEDKNVAWVSADPGSDLNKVMAPPTGVQYTDIAASSEISADSLRTFDAVIVSTDVTADSPMAKLLEENISFVPMINLNTSLFGYTSADVADTKLTALNKDNDIFAGVGIDENNQFDYINIGVGLPERFIGDDTLATCGPAVAIHQHKANRNTYILLASDAAFTASATDAWPVILGNAITMAANTKKSVVNASTPAINETYEEGKTTATITCSTAGSTIYYAIGDEEYKEYTEPLSFSDSLTVKAYAVAEGYMQSNTSTKKITIKHVVTTPSISMESNNGSKTITLSSDADAQIYYSFSGQKTTSLSALYTEPIVVKEPGTITAFAVADGKINSSTVAADFGVGGIPAVKDTLSHFTANDVDWNTNASVTVEGTTKTLADAIADGTSVYSSSAYYYFGKNAWSYYSTEVDHTETIKDEQGNDSTINIYKPDANAYKYVSSSSCPDWIIESSGQNITAETKLAPASGINGGTGRYADAAIDELGGLPSTGAVDFGSKTSGDPYTMDVKSTCTFTGDFDVVTYLGNGSGKDIYVALQTSADGSAWETVDTLNYSPTQRYYKKTRLHISTQTPLYLRVAQLGGGTKPQLYDIYVIRTEGLTDDAIQSVATDNVQNAQIRKYVRGGQVLIQTPRGTFTTVGARVK